MLSPLLAVAVTLAALHATPTLLDHVGPAPEPVLSAVEADPAASDFAAVLATCASLRTFAELTMTARQNGGAMGEYLSALNLSGGMADGLVRALVSDAWEEPAWHTDDNRADAISRFGVEAEAVCIEQLSSI